VSDRVVPAIYLLVARRRRAVEQAAPANAPEPELA